MGLRVLSVGAGDGYLEAWAASQITAGWPAGEPMDVRIDGCDIQEASARTAQRRLMERGIPGEWHACPAEDAPVWFAPGSYDAVVSFEVIEHVPDVEQYLSALEACCRPGGRVYLSTPEGTFGAGSNPNHLRVYRTVDLADLLRRRGELVDMEVGSDGVAAASYKPGPRREDIALYLGPCWQPWAHTDIELKGLGGSETAAVRLAEALAARGFIVTVYGDCEESLRGQVIYRHWTVYDPLDARDAVISSRMPELFDRPQAAAKRLLWMHDTDCGPRLTPDRAGRIDHILTLSEWHRGHVRSLYPFIDPVKVELVRNGIHPPYFQDGRLGWEERAQRCIYTSSPDRGLDILLELWPRVLEAAPDAVLAYCYPGVYDAVAEQDPAIAAHRDRIASLEKETGGVQRLGSLPQHQLAELMKTSRVWAHPSFSTPAKAVFHETSCIGAMEAQAAGCLVVASDWGALPETVRWGRLVNSGALSARWKDGLVKHIVEGLTDQKAGDTAVSKAPEAVAGLGWDGVAGLFETLVTGQIAGPARR